MVAALTGLGLLARLFQLPRLFWMPRLLDAFLCGLTEHLRV